MGKQSTNKNPMCIGKTVYPKIIGQSWKRSSTIFIEIVPVQSLVLIEESYNEGLGGKEATINDGLQQVADALESHRTMTL